MFLRSESSSAGVEQSMDGGVGKELQLRTHSADVPKVHSLVCFVLICQSARGTQGNYSI